MAQRVVILAGHRRSLSSIALTWGLSQLSSSVVRIVGVVCVSEFTWRRVMQWRRRLGGGLVQRVISELGMSQGGRFDDEREVYLQRLQAARVPHRNLQSLCRELGVPCKVVHNINDLSSVRHVESMDIDYAIYSGAGILRKPLIESTRKGVLNLHCGPLPHVRGMNAAEWSLFLGLIPEVTLHHIDSGIDTGKIIDSRLVPIQRGEVLGRIRARVVTAGLDLLIDTLPITEESGGRQNPIASGRQYYSMTDSIKATVQGWVNEGITPTTTSEATDPNDLRNALQRTLRKSA